MKRVVNGKPVDLEDSPLVFVTDAPDRVVVRSAGERCTALAVKVGDTTTISYRGRVFVVEKALARTKGVVGTGSGEIRSPMPGQIVEILVAAGDQVASGQRLITIEAMKTLQSFSAPFDGRVEDIPVSIGAQVAENDLLVRVAILP